MDLAKRLLTLSVELLVACVFINAEETQAGHWGAWGAMTPCSVTCGLGTRKMERIWIFGPDEKPSDEPYTSAQVLVCTHETFPDCPQDGIWSDWMGWTRCTKPCGAGLRERTRECQRQLYGGKACQGDPVEKEECNPLACPPLPRNFNLTQCKESYNFTCLSQKMCVPLTQKCDTLVQCHDGSDELDCRDMSLFRGGDVRYDFSLWGKGVPSWQPSIALTVIIPLMILSMFH
ncbi:hypothetical protein BsWGS_09792 [Bradybaena similaris]